MLTAAILGCLTTLTAHAETMPGPIQHHMLRDAGEVGIDVTVVGWGRHVARFDATGERHRQSEAHTVNVHGLSPTVGIIDGLQLGGEMVLVQSVAGPAGDPDQTRFGFGDLTLHGGGEVRLEPLDFGGRLTVKLPTGNSDAVPGNRAWPVGTGQSDLDMTAHIHRAAGDVTVLGQIGFTKRFVGEKHLDATTFEYEPGNIIHLQLGVTQWSSLQYAVGLAGLFYTAEAERWDLGRGLEPAGTGSAAASLVATFTVRAGSWVDLVLATRQRGVATGNGVVDTGMVIWGRNVPSTTLPPLLVHALFRI